MNANLLSGIYSLITEKAVKVFLNSLEKCFSYIPVQICFLTTVSLNSKSELMFYFIFQSVIAIYPV